MRGWKGKSLAQGLVKIQKTKPQPFPSPTAIHRPRGCLSHPLATPCRNTQSTPAQSPILPLFPTSVPSHRRTSIALPVLACLHPPALFHFASLHCQLALFPPTAVSTLKYGLYLRML